MARQLKDMVGTIAVITETKSQEFTAKKGKTMGQKFIIYSRGIKLEEHDEWVNIKGKLEKQVDEKLIDHITNTRFNIGDYVKIYLEAEDDEGRYWRVVSICRGDSSQRKPEKQEALPAIPIEEIEDAGMEEATEGQVLFEAEELIKKEGQLKSTTTKDTTDKVQDFREKEADKYELGMARNNAATIFAAMIQAMISQDATNRETTIKQFIKDNAEYYDKLVLSLYNRGKAIRKQVLGY